MNWQAALYAMLPEHLLLTGIVLTIVAGRTGRAACRCWRRWR
jgi:hypothetical protein